MEKLMSEILRSSLLYLSICIALFYSLSMLKRDLAKLVMLPAHLAYIEAFAAVEITLRSVES